LTDALRAATTDAKQIDRARLLGENIRNENGVATAIEAMYRDLEYARSLIKRTNTNDEEGDLNTSINKDEDSPPSGYSSSGSTHRSPSEDWSVISEQDDRRSSMSSQHSDGKLTRDCPAKRTSFTAAVLSVLPDSLTAGSPRSRRRSLSAAS
jgi:hypothetical protein